VLQIRGDTLFALPRGKSAMILYAASQAQQPLSEFVAASPALLTRAAEHGARYIRFAPAADPQAELARLLRNFEERFGAPPPAHQPAGPLPPAQR
jgi:hypothetical protein